MAEFKPRGSSDNEDEQIKSPVENWLESIFEEDPKEEDGNSKKKSKFVKLFRPVFRAIFPKTEKSTSSEQGRTPFLRANILGIDQEEGIKSDYKLEEMHEPTESEQVVYDKTKDDDISKIQKIEKKVDEDEKVDLSETPELVSDTSEESDRNDSEDMGGAYSGAFAVGGNAGFNYRTVVQEKEQVVITTKEKPSKISSYATTLVSEIASRRRHRKLKKEQKKLEKKQVELEEIEKKRALHTKIYNQNLNEKIKKTENTTKQLEKDAPIRKKGEESLRQAIKSIQEKIQIPNQKVEAQVVGNKEKAETPFLSLVKEDESKSSKKELEQAEINRIIQEYTDTDRGSDHPMTKTEKYFERKHEVKESPRAKTKINEPDNIGLHGALSASPSSHTKPHGVSASHNKAKDDFAMDNSSSLTKHKGGRFSHSFVLGEMLVIVIFGMVISLAIILVFFV